MKKEIDYDKLVELRSRLANLKQRYDDELSETTDVATALENRSYSLILNTVLFELSDFNLVRSAGNV